MTVGVGDEAYLAAFNHRLLAAAEGFSPDFVLISAGFDAHDGDSLGQMSVTAEGFAAMTRIAMGIADRHCQGRLVSVLEGGYDLAGLAQCAQAHVRALLERDTQAAIPEATSTARQGNQSTD